MKTAIQVHKEIEKRSKKTLDKLNIKSIKINQWVRQGDIYLTKIKEVTGKKEILSRKLAPGTSKGSRHIIEDNPSVKIFKGYTGRGIEDFQKGPQIEAKSNFNLTHPEHAHIKLPIGSYQVTYQMDWIKKERVRD